MKLAGYGDHTFNIGVREAETGMDVCEFKAGLVSKARSRPAELYIMRSCFKEKKKAIPSC